MIRMSSDAFRRLPRWMIALVCSPIAYDDACLLTCSDAAEIRHAVRGADGRVYDAGALHHFFSQYGSEARVLPHETIPFVLVVPWVCHVARCCWMRVVQRAGMIRAHHDVSSQPPAEPTDPDAQKSVRVDASTQTEAAETPSSAVERGATNRRGGLFLRVVEANRRRAIEERSVPRLGRRGLKRHAASAFVELSSNVAKRAKRA